MTLHGAASDQIKFALTEYLCYTYIHICTYEQQSSKV